MHPYNILNVKLNCKTQLQLKKITKKNIWHSTPISTFAVLFKWHELDIIKIGDFFTSFYYRRATAVVFSLEHQGRVIGRQSLSCRICSCPKRDKKSQENAYMKKSIQQNPDVQSPNNISYVPIKKKPKMMYHPQHNSILKQPSVIEQISGKGPSQLTVC